MPINPALLGAQLVAAVAPPDPLGAAGWLSIGTTIGAWLIPNITVLATGGTPLIAAGPLITGTGALIAGPTPTLGLALAAASASVDAAGIAKWLAVAAAIGTWITGMGGINPATLVAYVNPIPPVGAVAGVATLVFTGNADLATAAGSTDEAGIAKWTAVAQAIRTHLETLALVTPAMTNPAVGGPVLGTGTVA